MLEKLDPVSENLARILKGTKLGRTKVTKCWLGDENNRPPRTHPLINFLNFFSRSLRFAINGYVKRKFLNICNEFNSLQK